jgi:hypothetical protein
VGPASHGVAPGPRRRQVNGLDAVGGYCPTCGAEYRPGFDTCADDGTALVPGPRPEPSPEPMMAPEPTLPPGVRWVPVARFTREEEAHLLTGRLESEGIEATVYPAWQGGYYGESVNLPVSVLVPEHRVLEAREIIEEIRRTDLEEIE